MISSSDRVPSEPSWGLMPPTGMLRIPVLTKIRLRCPKGRNSITKLLDRLFSISNWVPMAPDRVAKLPISQFGSVYNLSMSWDGFEPSTYWFSINRIYRWAIRTIVYIRRALWFKYLWYLTGILCIPARGVAPNWVPKEPGRMMKSSNCTKWRGNRW